MKSNYKFSDKASVITIPAHEENGDWVKEKTVKGVYAFGKQAQPFTDENLTDDIAEYLILKDEYSDMIVSTKELTKKDK